MGVAIHTCSIFSFSLPRFFIFVAMLFNSVEFLFFFIIVTTLYFVLPHRFRWLMLLIASCVFYMAFIPAYILILFATIVIDYIAGIYIENAEGARRKQYLIISLITNIGVLAIFKYFNFFVDNVNALLLHTGISTHPLPFWEIILPIGLSFHTFQAMSYTIEVYRGHQKAERHFGVYALYVMFYPQLVAGPIERPQNLLHQFHEEHTFSYENLHVGLRLMLWGLFKKVVIADRLAIYANAVFGNQEQYDAVQLMIAVLCFTIQIYCDFSGYSDMAIGAARTMGFHLMVNFNRPYFSTNIQEFWAKWHMSLSTWFRDYLYISLGGNRVETWKVYRNVAIVFVVSGFWHGANWTFIVWGAIHAVCIVSYMLLKKRFSLGDSFIANAFGWLFTFIVVALAWVFFRAENIQQATTILHRIFTFDHVAVAQGVKNFGAFSAVVSLAMVAYMCICEWRMPPLLTKFQEYYKLDIAFMAITLFFILAFGVFQQASFIYFQF